MAGVNGRRSFIACMQHQRRPLADGPADEPAAPGPASLDPARKNRPELADDRAGRAIIRGTRTTGSAFHSRAVGGYARPVPSLGLTYPRYAENIQLS